MYDYTIEKTRFGLYVSVLKDGTKMVTGLTEDGVKIVTDTVHIPVLKGEFDGYTSKPRSSVVGGKLWCNYYYLVSWTLNALLVTIK